MFATGRLSPALFHDGRLLETREPPRILKTEEQALIETEHQDDGSRCRSELGVGVVVSVGVRFGVGIE